MLLVCSVTLLSFFMSCGNDPAEDMSEEFSATVNITASSSSFDEDAASVTVTIALSQQNTSGQSFVIPFSVTGSATSGSDYQFQSSSVTIGTNETSYNVQITILDDTDEESDETIVVTLGTLPLGLSSGNSTTVTMTIMDNDEISQPDPVTVAFGASSGNSITVDSWTDVSANRYIFVISNQNSFEDITSVDGILESTTYVGYDGQVVYFDGSIEPFTVSLLEDNSDYFLKVYPVFMGEVDNSQSVASQGTGSCETTSTSVGQVCFEISNDLRTITSNQLANHATGNFPNADPTAIQMTRALDLSPSYTGTAIYVYDETGPPTPSNDNFWQFGMASNGVEFHPMGLKPWTVPDGNPNAGEENWEWQAKVTESGETHVDDYGAHVTSQGNYHYHGDIVGLAADEDGFRHSLIYGFAADGFPIYYKFGYSDPTDPTSSIVELMSSYQLKSGSRSGTGTAGVDYPDGTHDGTYIQDYEFNVSVGNLDECNGRNGITPEFPGGTYYYVITSDFPVTPNCFFGTPADDWKIGQ